MTNVVVFLGPSLQTAVAREVLDAEYLGPAEVGSIYRAVNRTHPDIVVLVDGYFRDVLAVWHREILWALTQGVHVFGAASMGALRAAELQPFGMRGVGKIFNAYISGVYAPYTCAFEDDDEVAVVHGPAGTGFVQLSDAMVDIREGLARASWAGIISAETRDRAAEWAKRQYYPERTMAGTRQAIEAWAPEEAKRLRAWWETSRVSQKAEDVLTLLREVGKLRCQYPGPFRPAFEFQRVLVWERLRSKLDRQDGRPVQANS